MKKQFLLFVALLLFNAYGYGQVQSLNLRPLEDAQVNSDNPTTNYGTATESNAILEMSPTGNFQITRSFLKFDFTSIPPNAVITSAQLHLFNSGMPHTGNNRLEIARVVLAPSTSSWTESTIIWNNQPGYTAVNMASIPVTPGPNDYFADVTTLTQDIIHSTATGPNNEGYILKLEHEGPNPGDVANTHIASNDFSNIMMRPELVISYYVPQQIVLNPDMICPLFSSMNCDKLADEQTQVEPITAIEFNFGADLNPSLDVVIDLQANYQLHELKFWRRNGDTIKISVSVGDPNNWQVVGEVKLASWINSLPYWNSLLISSNTTTRFVKLHFENQQANLSEVYISGVRVSDNNFIQSPKYQIQTRTYDQIFGLNGFPWTKGELLTSGSSVREYHSWSYNDIGGNKYSFKTNVNDGNNYYPVSGYGEPMDERYLKWKNLGIDVNPCIQLSPTYMVGSNDPNSKPVLANDNPLYPSSYLAHAKYLYQFAARYGGTVFSGSNLNNIKTLSGQEKVTGLNYVKYMENWNEPDKWWVGWGFTTHVTKVNFKPFELAAMASADYDGHCNTLGSDVGILNADPNMKMILGSLAVIDLSYIKAIKLWSEVNRSSKTFPADVISFHHYCNDANGQIGVSTTGISPEKDHLKERLKEVVRYRNAYLPGVEIWLTEFGYDTDPNSIIRSPALGTTSNFETQARWMLRSYLEIAASGIDRAHWYLTNDQVSDTPHSPGKFNTCGLAKDVYNNETKKTAWYYMAFFKSKLAGYHFAQEVVSTLSLRVYKFSKAGEPDYYAIWSPTNSNATIAYNLSIGDSRRVKVYTPSATNTTGTMSIINGSNSVATITASELPVLVRIVPKDIVPPVANAKAIKEVYLNSDGEAFITPQDINNGSSDNIGIVSYELSRSVFNCNDVYNPNSVEIVSDPEWKQSVVTILNNNYNDPWDGIYTLPNEGSYTLNAPIEQPYSWGGINVVPGSEPISAGSDITFFKRTFNLTNPNFSSLKLMMTMDDNVDVYINGVKIVREMNVNVDNGISTPHEITFLGISGLENGSNGLVPFDEVYVSNLAGILVSGENTIHVVLRNLNPATPDRGGFSIKLSFDYDGLIPVTLTVKDDDENATSATTFIRVHDDLLPVARVKNHTLLLSGGNATLTTANVENGSSDNCNAIVTTSLSKTSFSCADYSPQEALTIASDVTWQLSPEFKEFEWNPWHDGEFPYTWIPTNFSLNVNTNPNGHIDPVAGAMPIQAENDIRFYRKTFYCNGTSDFSALIKATVDDQLRLFINGHLILKTGLVSGNNTITPGIGIEFLANGGFLVNGVPLAYITNLSASEFLKHGENEIIVVVQNSINADQGAFSFNMLAKSLIGTPVTYTVQDAKGYIGTETAYITVKDPSNFCGLNKMGRSNGVNEGTVSTNLTNTLEVYPNPVGDKLTIKQNTDKVLPSRIKISDLTGKVVKEINGFTQQGMMERFIDVSEFAAGLLLVEVQTGDQISVHKILKY